MTNPPCTSACTKPPTHSRRRRPSHLQGAAASGSCPRARAPAPPAAAAATAAAASGAAWATAASPSAGTAPGRAPCAAAAASPYNCRSTHAGRPGDTQAQHSVAQGQGVWTRQGPNPYLPAARRLPAAGRPRPDPPFQTTNKSPPSTLGPCPFPRVHCAVAPPRSPDTPRQHVHSARAGQLPQPNPHRRHYTASLPTRPSPATCVARRCERQTPWGPQLTQPAPAPTTQPPLAPTAPPPCHTPTPGPPVRVPRPEHRIRPCGVPARERAQPQLRRPLHALLKAHGGDGGGLGGRALKGRGDGREGVGAGAAAVVEVQGAAEQVAGRLRSASHGTVRRYGRARQGVCGERGGSVSVGAEAMRYRTVSLCG